MKKLNKYEITPNIGIDNLVFGESIIDSLRILGEPNHREQDEYGILLGYPDFNLMFSETGELEEIGFIIQRVKLTICGILIVEGDKNLKPHITLKKLDPKPIKTEGGTLLFLNIGVSLVSYPTYTSNRAVTCFRQGTWDGLY